MLLDLAPYDVSHILWVLGYIFLIIEASLVDSSGGGGREGGGQRLGRWVGVPPKTYACKYEDIS